MPSTAALVDLLNRISQLMDILGEDSFRSSANARAARALESATADVATIASGKDAEAAKAALQEIDGVGPKIADKIIEYFTTGRVHEHDELAAKVPAGLLTLLNIPGLGPKTIRALWQTLNVTDLAALKRVIADGSILTVPRMGEKAVEKLKSSIALVEQGQDRLWLGQALPLAQRLVRSLESHPGVKKIAFAGSLRRGKETIGDIDILVATSDPASVSEAFRSLPAVTQVLVAGDTKSSVRVAIDPSWGRWQLEGQEGQAKVPPSIQCDLRVIPMESWGAALMYFTGSKEHNVLLRQRALDRGLTLNEYGLFPDDPKPSGRSKKKSEETELEPPHRRGIKPVASKTEEDIYAALDLPYIQPEIREAHGELDLKATPRLIELADIKAELHAHTRASDGTMTIEELAASAKARGFHTIAITDHSQSSTIANGLRPDRLALHVEAIRKTQEKFTDRSGKHTITLLAGSEVDILADGSLDYSDKVLATLDIVVASAHAALSQDPAAATKRLLTAIRHPRVNILGHPTGRLINRRAGLSPDINALVAAAHEHRVALEINAHWLRLDLRDNHVRAALAAGCLIAINCDVHAPDDGDNLIFGVATGRRGGLAPEQCINTWPAKKLHDWLAAKRA